MHAHLLQLDIAWHDRRANFEKVERLLAKAGPGAGDLAVLPEMFDTGFSMEPAVTSDTAGETLEFLKATARARGIYLHGGRTILEPGRGKAHNRATIISPKGELILEYTKVHPFTFGREPEFFEGGDAVATYQWGQSGGMGDALTVGAAICYDLRFPELFRIALGKGAQAFALGANWPAARQHHWRSLLIARAIENQAFVLGVNRTGNDPKLAYAGGSIVVGPKGEILGELGAGEEVLSVRIDPAEVHEWRETFPAWKDARLLRAATIGQW